MLLLIDGEYKGNSEDHFHNKQKSIVAGVAKYMATSASQIIFEEHHRITRFASTSSSARVKSMKSQQVVDNNTSAVSE